MRFRHHLIDYGVKYMVFTVASIRDLRDGKGRPYYVTRT